MTFEAHEPSILGVNFEVETQVDTPDRLIAATKRGAAWVWNRTTEKPTTIRLSFTDQLVDDNGKPQEASGSYSPRHDIVAVALDRIREGTAKLPNWDEKMSALVGGHEAAHRVQVVHRGEQPRPSAELIAEGIYEDDPHELEAWEESLQAFALLYPGERYIFPVGSRTHVVPSRSKYESRFHRESPPSQREIELWTPEMTQSSQKFDIFRHSKKHF